MEEHFREVLSRFPPQRIKELVAAATPERIERALSREQLTLEDFGALVSPRISDSQLELLARRAHRLTCRRFGRIILLYAPLYLSNECSNGCRYCGFNAENQLPRRTLRPDEIEREVRILHELGFRHLLLLTGEAPRVAGIDYLENAVRLVKPWCGSISIEVFPMDREGYGRMVAAGVDGLTLYQETYDPELYRDLHPYGPKSDYEFRLRAPEAAGEAGFRRLGIGALLGLGDPLVDIFSTALHARWLARRFWRTQVTISFPRLRPAEGAIASHCEVSDRQLTQFICALRLFLPDAGLVLSTRESAALRDHLLPLGITQMSAGSCTAPGGYGDSDEQGEQFEISDRRSPAEFARVLTARGYEVVWKDWDTAFLDPVAGETKRPGLSGLV
ncbi:MAG: 2-iminoacetate synthase ThiH [Deltaproteobacteria bacterium]|nr:2-iminoacetate synthase ThiH [Deltaproteobacteria bacterium]